MRASAVARPEIANSRAASTMSRPCSVASARSTADHWPSGRDPERHERVLLGRAGGALGRAERLDLVEVGRVLRAVERVRAVGAVVLGAPPRGTASHRRSTPPRTPRCPAASAGTRPVRRRRSAGGRRRGRRLRARRASRPPRPAHRDAGVLGRAVRDRLERGVELRLEVGGLVREQVRPGRRAPRSRPRPPSMRSGPPRAGRDTAGSRPRSRPPRRRSRRGPSPCTRRSQAAGARPRPPPRACSGSSRGRPGLNRRRPGLQPTRRAGSSPAQPKRTPPASSDTGSPCPSLLLDGQRAAAPGRRLAPSRDD